MPPQPGIIQQYSIKSSPEVPHIILSGVPDLLAVQNAFKSFRGDSNDWIIKVQHCLVSETASTLVFDCTAVRSGFSQDFYIRAEKKDGRLSIRVDPYMRIERNEGVQRSILAVSRFIKGQCPVLVLDKSNLPENVLGPGLDQ